MHKAMEKPYWSSATDKDFQKVLMNPNSNLKLIIHKWGSVKEMKQLEYEMLTKVNAAASDDYYNKHNGHPGVKEIDYIIGDIYSIPEKDHKNYTEKVLQFKNTTICKSSKCSINSAGR
jgi:hypothetical protein